MLMFQQMLILFIMMLIGFIAYKKEVINNEACKKISGIVVNIANPALVISSVLGDNAIYGKELLITAIVAISLYIALIIIAFLIPKLLHINYEAIGSYKVMTVFSNIGFMGFPIISSIYGNSALLYASVFLIPYNFLIYTYGIRSIKKEKTREKVNILKMFNIGVISCLVTIFLYITNIQIPEWSQKSIIMLSNLTAPLSMMVIGASFATIKFMSMIKDIKLLIFALIKLLIVPICGTLIIGNFVTNEVLIGVSMIMLATPIGSMTAMIAQEYNGDYEFISRGVALTTVLSMITIPIVSAFCM